MKRNVVLVILVVLTLVMGVNMVVLDMKLSNTSAILSNAEVELRETEFELGEARTQIEVRQRLASFVHGSMAIVLIDGPLPDGSIFRSWEKEDAKILELLESPHITVEEGFSDMVGGR